MKKILSFVLFLLVLSSCSEDVKFNNEAVFQGVLDNAAWKGANAKATLDANNKLTIEAVTLTEHMALEFPAPTIGVDPRNDDTFVTFVLGTNNNSKAFYDVKSTVNTYEYETAIGVGDGQVVVSQYDGTTVSGTFRFNAKNVDPDSEGNEIVNVQSGVFYKVPIYTAP